MKVVFMGNPEIAKPTLTAAHRKARLAWAQEHRGPALLEACLPRAGRLGVLSVLEGGYNVPALARCVTAHVAQLKG